MEAGQKPNQLSGYSGFYNKDKLRVFNKFALGNSFFQYFHDFKEQHRLQSKRRALPTSSIWFFLSLFDPCIECLIHTSSLLSMSMLHCLGSLVT